MAVSKRKFSPDDGKFIEAEEAQVNVDRFHKKRRAQGFEKKVSYVHSQFFGKNVLQELLALGGKDCVGLRINFAVSESINHDDGLVIYAVNADGKPIGTKIRQGKDLADFEIKAVAYGPTCPDFCLPPPKEEGDEND